MEFISAEVMITGSPHGKVGAMYQPSAHDQPSILPCNALLVGVRQVGMWSNGALVREVGAHAGPVRCMRMHHDTDTLLTGGSGDGKGVCTAPPGTLHEEIAQAAEGAATKDTACDSAATVTSLTLGYRGPCQWSQKSGEGRHLWALGAPQSNSRE